MADFSVIPRTTPTMVTGARDTAHTVAERIIADVSDEILLYMPTQSPLTTLTGKLRAKRKATQFRYDFLEKDVYPRTVHCAAAVTVGATAVQLNTGEGVQVPVNMVVMNSRTREQFLVTAAPTVDLLGTVVRGIGSVAAPMEVGDELILTRVVNPDGATIGTMKSVMEVDNFNYTEIVRTPYGWTGRQMATSMYGGKDTVTEEKWQGIEHARQLESVFYFGRRHTRTDATTGTQQSFSGGLEYFIQSNVWDLGGARPSERSFVEMLEEGMRYGKGGYQSGSGTKYFFGSARWMTEIEFWAKDRIQYRPLDKSIGLVAGEYRTTHGTVMLLHSPILDDAHPDYGFLVDLNHVRYVYLQGRDTKLLRARQENDRDGEWREYMTDFGAQVELEASHTLVKGLAV